MQTNLPWLFASMGFSHNDDSQWGECLHHYDDDRTIIIIDANTLQYPLDGALEFAMRWTDGINDWKQFGTLEETVQKCLDILEPERHMDAAAYIANMKAQQPTEDNSSEYMAVGRFALGDVMVQSLGRFQSIEAAEEELSNRYDSQINHTVDVFDYEDAQEIARKISEIIG